MILAGDVGGTKTLLGVFRLEGRRLRSVREESYSSAEAPSLEAMVSDFLGRGGRPSRAVFGVAGPVVGGRSGVVNLRWTVDARRVVRATGVADVAILNDVEAAGWGIPELTPRQVAALTPGRRPGGGNGALLAVGTGLGMAILVRDGTRLRPSATEGGHQDLPVRNETEWDLLRFLQHRFGRVSLERVAAGPGFSAIYEFLVDRGRGAQTPRMRERLLSGDANAVVSEAGVEGTDATAARAVELFASVLGAAAGNLALVAKATAGVWIGGGVAPKILPVLRSGAFLASFRDKGRLASFLDTIPVKVILEPRLPLLGAAAYAARELSSRSRR